MNYVVWCVPGEHRDVPAAAARSERGHQEGARELAAPPAT